MVHRETLATRKHNLLSQWRDSRRARNGGERNWQCRIPGSLANGLRRTT